MIISNNEDIQCVQKIGTVQKIYVFSIIFHNKSVPFQNIKVFSITFFTISRYLSKYLRIFHHFFHNKSVPFKISSYLPSFFFTKNGFSFPIYITDISYFKKFTYYFGISSSLDSLFIHLWHLPPHQRFHLFCLFGLPPLGLSNKLPVSNNLVLQVLIMRCSGGSKSYCTRSLSLTSFMA